ncbi:MAG TPA: hypothetical protein VGO47_13360 [Chlamydiales bacterium]|nr:hypothetical protein [Chlamydiales bacterium]
MGIHNIYEMGARDRTAQAKLSEGCKSTKGLLWKRRHRYICAKKGEVAADLQLIDRNNKKKTRTPGALT